MKLTQERLDSIIKQQTIIWITAVLFASGYALFAKLIWTAKFPILIFLPMFLIGFALASINNVRTVLSEFVEKDA